ncbi:LexA family transcriptional regulator [Salinicola tamaricis]|uniref:helix-turn-helix transcriptional regulator n=1 Tax=Salinicola tamaricis TaxID=1771309 RepID=UPI001A933710
MNFANRLRHAREASGLSQSELARRLGVRQQSVQLWESTGERATTPRAKRIKELAAILETPEEWLFLGRAKDEETTRGNMQTVPLLRTHQILDAFKACMSNVETPRVYCPSPCSERTFAIIVERDFPECSIECGDTLFVDPGADLVESRLSLSLASDNSDFEIGTNMSTSNRISYATIGLYRDLRHKNK